jgi:predicted glutamine amidotransferase
LCIEIVVGPHAEEETIFNFVLSCGPYTLFAYSWPGRHPGSTVWNGLHYILHKPPFHTATLLDDNYKIDFEKVTMLADHIPVLVATKPLTSEEDEWVEMKCCELLMFDKGMTYQPCA